MFLIFNDKEILRIFWFILKRKSRCILFKYFFFVVILIVLVFYKEKKLGYFDI